MHDYFFHCVTVAGQAAGFAPGWEKEKKRKKGGLTVMIEELRYIKLLHNYIRILIICHLLLMRKCFRHSGVSVCTNWAWAGWRQVSYLDLTTCTFICVYVLTHICTITRTRHWLPPRTTVRPKHNCTSVCYTSSTAGSNTLPSTPPLCIVTHIHRILLVNSSFLTHALH